VTLLNETPDAQHELLDSINDEHVTIPTFESCLDAHGMYETMRFVLRLSPRNHELMKIIEAEAFEPETISSEAIQAYSTYIHETIHWWQHVGSTSGLLFSLSYLAQSHSSMEELREVLATFGPKKSMKRWTDQVLTKEGVSAQAKLGPANIAVNNALDVEYYKSYAYDPRVSIKWMTRASSLGAHEQHAARVLQYWYFSLAIQAASGPRNSRKAGAIETSLRIGGQYVRLIYP
jgi:hypothetical protein